MTGTLTIRIDATMKQRLDALSKRSKRSKSSLAVEAIVAYVESEEWQLAEIQSGMAERDSGHEVSHAELPEWLGSWGKAGETRAD